MSRRIFFTVLFIMGSFCFGPTVEQASACPMCKTANEADDFLPRAYMYSIIFMLSVPATIFSGIGIGLYRLNRQENESLNELDQLTPENHAE